MARERALGQQHTAAVDHRLEKQAVRHKDHLKSLIESLTQSNEAWNSTTESQRDNMIAALYQTEPFAYNWLSVRREYHDEIQEAQAFAQKNGRLTTDFASHTEQDIYAMSFQKTSLLAMEKMEPPLSIDDVRQINSLFKFRKNTPPHQQNVQIALTFLAVQPYAQPRTKAIPRNIESLHETITNYFDYYTQLLASPNISIEDESKLLLTLVWNGSRLSNALAAYLPARLGITPSSAEKLFHRRVALAASPVHRLHWNNINKMFDFTKRVADAYNPADVPPKLEPYIHYDSEMDASASRLLQSVYADRLQSPEDRFTAHDQKEALLSQVPNFRKDLRRDILQDPQKVKRIETPTGHPVQELIASQIYKGNLIFVLKFDPTTHLTLEVDSKGTVYGFPPELGKSHPHIEDLVLVDTLAQVARLYPKPEAPVMKLPKRPIYVPAEKKLSDEVFSPDDTPKRKRLKALQQRVNTVFSREPDLPEVIREEKPKRILSFSEEEVRRFVGDRVDIDPILTALSRFELGEKGLQALQDQDHLYKLRVGDMRVILKSHGEGRYSLFDIDNRRDVYKRL